MDGFFLDNQRKLVVKLSIRNAQSSPPAIGSTSANSATSVASRGADTSGTPSVSTGGGKSVWVPRGNR